MVARCMKEGLVGGEGFAVDAERDQRPRGSSRSTAREGAEDLRDQQHANMGRAGTLPHSMRRVSHTFGVDLADDPGARWTAVDGPAFYADSTNYLIDVQAGIIVDVEATPTLRTAEVKVILMMIERVEERFDLKLERLIGDMAYGMRTDWAGR